MQCSIGMFTQEECHKPIYGKVSKNLANYCDLSDNDQTLLKLRLGREDLKSVCKYHEKKFITKYHHLFGQVCCDPLKYHTGQKKKGNKGCIEIKLECLKKDKKHQLNLVPGKSLCPTCYKKIFVSNEEIKERTNEELFVPPEIIFKKLDAVCFALDMSPVSKLKRLSSEKKSSALAIKTKKITHDVAKKLENCFSQSVELNDEGVSCSNPLCNEYSILIEKLKEKCAISSNNEKVKIISLMPSCWSKSKICQELQVSEYLVRITRELVRQEGILPDSGKKYGRKLDEAVITSVQEFFQLDDNSRICPGMKDCLSVEVNGVKEQRQKRLILCNLRELYVHFKNTYPDLKIGLSKFCTLRPKWCVLAGSAGTHTVCVCLHHQNVKLMLEGGNLNIDYKDLLKLMTCNTERYECMMDECSSCPGVQVIYDYLKNEMAFFEMSEAICYKQWVSTDRADLMTILKSTNEFVDSLIEKLIALKKHHFVSKAQSQFLKETKENLTETDCIVLADFAENYSFVVQDEIQSFHWVNTQATLHPFVHYYKSDGIMKSHSMCIISDHLEHNTVSFHTFQQHLVGHIKEKLPSVKKLIYFSDGAVSQYKNKKNFINICNHNSDFGLNAEWNFFASAHGKNACDGVGGTTKRVARKASLQRTYKNHILTPKDLYDFCITNITGITYIFVSSEVVQANELVLNKRFENCKAVPQTREKHRLVPLNVTTIRCYRTSKSSDYQDVSVAARQTGLHCSHFKNEDYIACIYDNEWWIAMVEKINFDNYDLYVKFFKPAGPRTSFQKSTDTCWVPLSNVLRKLTPLELTTPTGRSYKITEKLCNEISHLYNENCH